MERNSLCQPNFHTKAYGSHNLKKKKRKKKHADMLTTKLCACPATGGGGGGRCARGKGGKQITAAS